jgi:hypothetical protein
MGSRSPGLDVQCWPDTVFSGRRTKALCHNKKNTVSCDIMTLQSSLRQQELTFRLGAIGAIDIPEPLNVRRVDKEVAEAAFRPSGGLSPSESTAITSSLVMPAQYSPPP